MAGKHSGPIHHITYQIIIGGPMNRVQAVCSCDKLNPPPRFGREKAEEDARQHLLEYAPTKGIPVKRGKSK